MTVYIAGPISGDAGYKVKFAAVVNMIRKAEPGASILNPGALPEGMSRADYMAICLQMLVAVHAFAGGGLCELTRIAADGKISPDERERYDAAITELRSVVSAALHTEFAKEKEG